MFFGCARRMVICDLSGRLLTAALPKTGFLARLPSGNRTTTIELCDTLGPIQELPMRRSVLIFTVIFAAALPALAASVQTAKPEQTGFSSERLARIHEMVQRHMDAHDISGAVTLVARNGKVAHFEAHGLMDIEAQKPMSKDSLFWIMSMTKPVVGTAVLMLMEEGKLRLTDPVSRFIPGFKRHESRSDTGTDRWRARSRARHATHFLHGPRDARAYDSGLAYAYQRPQHRRSGKHR